jgi:hypothetical protein
MKRNTQLILIVVILLVSTFIIFYNRESRDTDIPKPSPEVVSIVGCYVSRTDKNVYTLNIQSQNDSSFSGTMHYDNFQFDDSSGTYNGSYKNEILLGDYSFTSEGMDSVRELTFKKTGEDFVQGFGDYITVGDRQVFSGPSGIVWDPAYTYVKSPCE